MSWGYISTFQFITGGNYQGTAWTGTTKQAAYGMIGNASNNYGERVGSVDVDVAELLAAGVVLVGAAGNYSQTIDVLGGSNYNNYWNSSIFGTMYYMQGGSPACAVGVVCVGNVSTISDTPEQKAATSESGPRVDVYAPGTNIVSTTSNVNTFGATATYPNSNFKIASISGTSMASPNVTGAAAQLLQLHPDYTPAQIRALIIADSTADMLITTGSATDYANTISLHGGSNRFAYMPYNISYNFNPLGAMAIGPGITIGPGVTIGPRITSGGAESGPIVTSGLQVQLRPSSYSGSGTTWTDTQGNADATLVGSPSYNGTTGFTFDGSTQYGTLPSIFDKTDFDNSGSYTIEVWFNATVGQPVISSILLSKRANLNAQYPYAVDYSEPANVVSNYADSGGQNATNAVSVNVLVSNWYQNICVWNYTGSDIGENGADKNTAWLNGVKQTSSNGNLSNYASPSNNYQVSIAGPAQGAGGAGGFKGQIGIVRIYNRALTGAEIQQNFDADKGIFGL
jgi:hypothetical protein